MENDKSYRLLKTFSRLTQAELELNKLEDEGIDAYLTDKNMGSISFLEVATGGVKMHVAKDEFERAKKILSDV